MKDSKNTKTPKASFCISTGKSESEYPDDQPIQHLSKDIFTGLIQIENNLKHKKRKQDLTLLNKAIKIYVTCIEHYDQLNDPIQLYFLDKLQQSITQKRAIIFVNKHKSKNLFLGVTPKQSQTFANNVFQFINSSDDEGIEESRPCSISGGQQSLIFSDEEEYLKPKALEQSYHKKTIGRAKKILLLPKYEQIQNEDQYSPEALIRNHEKQSEEQFKIVVTELHSQTISIQDRLKQRQNIIKQKAQVNLLGIGYNNLNSNNLQAISQHSEVNADTQNTDNKGSEDDGKMSLHSFVNDDKEEVLSQISQASIKLDQQDIQQKMF